METHDYLIDHAGLDWEKLLGSWEWLFEDDMEVAPWLVSRFGDLFFVDELGPLPVKRYGGRCFTPKQRMTSKTDQLTTQRGKRTG